MFKHVFGVMHEMLDEIIFHYPYANPCQKKRLDEQLAKLLKFSDTFMEEWLQFEEKVADFRSRHEHPLPQHGNPDAAPSSPSGAKETAGGGEETLFGDASAAAFGEADAAEDAMSKGQGYFKLFMFHQAAEHFREAVIRSPENYKARLYLAMTYMHMQEWNEAQRHFQLIVELTDHRKWKALGYNALGCIQAIRMNMEQAAHYFEKAHEADPNFADPLTNMKSCQQHEGHLSLYFGSGQL